MGRYPHSSHTTTKVASHEALGKNLAGSSVTFPQETPMASNAEQEGRYTVMGDLTLHGMTRAVTFPVQGEVQAGFLHGWGSFRLLQSHFGYKPYSAFLGAIRNQEEVMLHFDIVAGP
jgi:polyisoprenoid-binding protein YceI